MEYKVAVQTSLEGIENLVIKLRKEGWKLQGGLSVVLVSKTETDIIFHYYQAVIREG